MGVGVQLVRQAFIGGAIGRLAIRKIGQAQDDVLLVRVEQG